MRLPRPYVPWSTRRVVIERQLRAAGDEPTRGEKYTGSDERATRWMVERLFPFTTVELHHDPALVNRNRLFRSGNATEELPPGAFIDGWKFVGYRPDANDPNFLAYMPVNDHDVRTRVRGAHGQHSDLALARKRKRIERKAKRPKRKWPKRKLRWSRS